MLTRVSVRRLLRLADHLDTKVERKHFAMSSWCEAKDPCRPSCGTTACALGHACSIPSLRAAGLKLLWDENHTSALPVFDPEGETKGMTSADYYCNDAMYGTIPSTYGAAMQVFGLTDEAAENLFSPDGDRLETPKQVARRIRRFVKKNAHTPE